MLNYQRVAFGFDPRIYSQMVSGAKWWWNLADISEAHFRKLSVPFSTPSPWGTSESSANRIPPDYQTPPDDHQRTGWIAPDLPWHRSNSEVRPLNSSKRPSWQGDDTLGTLDSLSPFKKIQLSKFEKRLENHKYHLINQHNYGKSPWFMGKLTISMVMFNSYVKKHNRG